jgi:hypothetical protein
MRQEKNFLCGVSGIFLSATRSVGVLMSLSYLIFCWRSFFRAKYKQKIKMILIGQMFIAGLLCFMLFLHFKSGDAFAFIYAQKAWGRVFENPFLKIFYELKNPNSFFNSLYFE